MRYDARVASPIRSLIKATSQGAVVRPLGALAAGLTRIQDRLYQPPDELIPGMKPTDWPSPLQPVRPFGEPDAQPLGFNMWMGQNLIYTPRPDSRFTAADLQALARYPLARLCMTNVIDTITSLKWKVQLRAQPGEEQKVREKKQLKDDTILKLTDFLGNPNADEDFCEFWRKLINDMLAIDAGCALLRRTPDNVVYEWRPIQGAYITRLVDRNGYIPQAPAPAYQQLWEGIPRVNLSTDQLVYRPRNIVYDVANPWTALYGMCYDDQTEILTRDGGWKLFANLTDDDAVATRNSKTKSFEWQKPSKKITNDYRGEMYHFASKALDLRVTSNHRMLIETPTAGDAGWNESIITAEELAGCWARTHTRKIPMHSVWSGIELGSREFKSGVHNRFNLKISGDDFCALMGAYLAEGNLRAAGGIEIAQSKYSKGFALFSALIKRINKNGKDGHNGRAFVLSRRAITGYFRQFGLAHEKFIPSEIKNASVRQLRIFWEHYCHGDGHFSVRANRSGRGKPGRRRDEMTTVSKRLADDLVEIAAKLGVSASVGERPERMCHFPKGYNSMARRAYHIRVRYSKRLGGRASKECYEGRIYCVTVPNGIVYVRRNGKPAWCGNSPTEQLAEELEVGIQRLRYVKAFYKDGSIPNVLWVVPAGTKADVIEDAQKILNMDMAGNLESRRQIRFAQGFRNQDAAKEDQIKQFKEPHLSDEYDDLHIKRVCFGYGVSAQRMTRPMNRASAQTNQEAAEEEGIAPYRNWVEDFINVMLQRKMGYQKYEFRFDVSQDPDPTKQAEIDAAILSGGTETINERRVARGLDPRTEPEADQLGKWLATGWMGISEDPPSAAAGEGGGSPAPEDTDDGADDGDPKPKGDGGEPTGKKKLAKARDDEPIALLNPARDTIRARTARAQIFTQVWKFFDAIRSQMVIVTPKRKTAKSKLRKDDQQDEIVEKIMDSIGWKSLPSAVKPGIGEAANDGASVGLDEAQRAYQAGPGTVRLSPAPVRVIVSAVISEVNQVAASYAEERAAELVGMKWVDGELVQNPNAAMAITDSTRNMLREIITEAFEHEAPISELVDRIRQAGVFSEERAKLIADTEVKFAQSRGNLAAWKKVGVVKKVRWITSSLHDEEDECDENEDAGSVDLGSNFPSGVPAPPAHPRCRCTAAIAELNEPKKTVAG